MKIFSSHGMIQAVKLAAIVASLGVASIGSASAQDLYLIMGQSNAAGRDTNIDSRGEDSSTSNVQLFTDGNTFQTAAQPLNRYSNVKKSTASQGVNFGLEFGKKMYSLNGRKVYLVVNARGGTSVASWREGKSTGYFTNTVRRVKDAESACNCRLKGILWHQGENNVSNDGSYDSSYFSSLEGLINEYRDELRDVPFLVGQLYQKSSNSRFNNALKTLDDGNFVDDVDWVTSKNLSTTGDDTHFNAASTRTLGERYAKVLDKM